MSNYDDMALMRNEIRSVINNNNFKEDVSIIRPYDETMESYIVFERGNVDLNARFWDKKSSLPTDSPFIRQYKGIETSISTMIGDDIDKKVILKDDYRLYRKNNLPKPSVKTNIQPEILELNGNQSYIFSDPVSLTSSNPYGLETSIDYEYESNNIENPTDLFTDYEQGSLLEDAGHYSFKLRTYINYGLETFYSDTTNYDFELVYESNTFREPVFRQNVDSDGKIILTLETNTNDDRYKYDFTNNNTGENLNNYFIKYDEDTNNVKYKWRIEKYGIYNINLHYYNDIFDNEINTLVVYTEEKEPDSSAAGLLKYHKSTDTKLSNRYNNAYLETNVKDVDDRFYVADATETINGTSKKSRMIIASGYIIPFYYPTVLNLIEAVVDDKHRNHIHDPINPTNTDSNPLSNYGKGHKIASKENYKIDSVDSDLTPDKPVISLFSETPIENKFNKRPSETDENTVMNSVDINIINGNSDWETEIMINGEKFKDTNINYDKSGEHKIVAIFRDRFNYTMNYSTAKISIKKDYLYSPIDMSVLAYDKEQNKVKDKNSITSDAYLVDINFFFITDEILKQRKSTGIESEESLCKKKQYRIDNGNWTDYTDDTQIIVEEACTLEARKVMIDETIIRDSVEITPEMMGYNLPIPPIFLGSDYNNKEEGYSYFPVIEKNMGHTYRLELNGKPLKFGTPIISNGAVNDYEEFKLTAYSKHYRFPDREAQTTITFRAKNRPPEKPYLDGIKNKEINHITDKDFKVKISDFEPGVEYFIKVNDRVLNHGDKLFEDSDYKLNGVFIITVIAKNKLGLTSYNSYYIDNNRNIADDYHELDYERNSLILNSRDKTNYEFNNEMIMDLRTGDISYTDSEGKLIDITADIKEKLNRIEAHSNNINVNTLIMRGNISLLLDELSYIKKNNDFLENNVKEIIDKLESIGSIINKSNNLKKDLEKLKEDINANMKLVNTLSKSVKSKTNEINSNINTIKKEIIDTLPVQRENISLIAKSHYNLKSIDIEARKKISKKEFKAFKNKYEKFLKDIESYIKNF